MIWWSARTGAASTFWTTSRVWNSSPPRGHPATPTLFALKPVTLYNVSDAVSGGPRGSGALADRAWAAPNPPFGATLQYYLPLSPRGSASLAILDSTGARVRDLQLERGAGLHRVTWDLRYNAPYATPPRAGGAGAGGAPAFFRGGPTGPFVLPGRYTAELRIDRPGAEAQVYRTAVLVRPDPLVTLTAAEYRALHDARMEAGRAQATVQAVVRSAEQVESELTEARTAVRSAHAPDSLSRQVEAVSRELTEVLREVRGASGAQRGADDEEADGSTEQPSIQQRVNSVAQQIGNVSSLPTQIQRETLAGAMTELAKQVDALNRLVATRVPALYRALDAADVPWSLGRPVPGLRAGTGGR